MQSKLPTKRLVHLVVNLVPLLVSNSPGKQIDRLKLPKLSTDTDENAEGWTEASDRLSKHDAAKYRGMGDDVDTVLVVVSPFI